MTDPKLGDHFPTREKILEFIEESPAPVDKKEIARAFNLKGAQRAELNNILKELRADGSLRKGRKKWGTPGRLPAVCVLEILDATKDGDLPARPLQWEEDTEPPAIFIRTGARQSGPPPTPGDRVLARMSLTRDGAYEARVMKIVSTGPRTIMGIYSPGERDARVSPTDRKNSGDIAVELEPGIDHGELVVVELTKGKHFGLRRGRVLKTLGNINEPKSISLVSIHARGIPTEFTPEARKQAEDAQPVGLDGRTDLRDIPLVTIDGSDARDFDDAVWAEADSDPNNPGGYHVMVAIADVSWYVRPGSPLDKDALERGNSVYFPDRVVPMLPFELSNGLCSLVPNEDRGCLAVEMWITAEGKKLRHKFCRGLMRSAARLTYDEVQAHKDGSRSSTQPSIDGVIMPLYGAYEAFEKDRKRRGVLDLDLPERKIHVDEDGKVAGVKVRERFDSHKLIENFMIAANVCAAEELEKRQKPCMYRIHDEPAEDKLAALREFLTGMGYAFPKAAAVKPMYFNQVLVNAKGKPEQDLINTVVLRSQSQAMYSPDNIGHFGLSLMKYAHFTSPIRRYADLLVHRALVAGLKLGDGGLPPEAGAAFEDIGEAISGTERRAAMAERDAVDRYVAAYMMDKVGQEFAGRISGVQRFGLFISLDATGADGLLPIGYLPQDYYVHDEAQHRLVGKRTRQQFQLGDQIAVKVAASDVATGSLELRLADGPDGPAAQKGPLGKMRGRDPSRRPGSGGRKKPGQTRSRSGFGARKKATAKKPMR